MTYFQAVAGELQEIIDNVRKLHYDMSADCNCRDCTPTCGECNDSYPCDTIEVLNGRMP